MTPNIARKGRPVCEVCRSKARKIAVLAQYFRERAAETRLDDYAGMMAETADALSELSRHFAERCRCDEDEAERARVFGTAGTADPWKTQPGNGFVLTQPACRPPARSD